jgi:hypothetical protein
VGAELVGRIILERVASALEDAGVRKRQDPLPLPSSEVAVAGREVSIGPEDQRWMSREPRKARLHLA